MRERHHTAIRGSLTTLETDTMTRPIAFPPDLAWASVSDALECFPLSEYTCTTLYSLGLDRKLSTVWRRLSADERVDVIAAYRAASSLAESVMTDYLASLPS